MGGFLSSLFGGSNPTLNKNIAQFGSESGFGRGIGEGDVTEASKFYSDILSGDPTKMAEALSPEIKSLQDQAQQKKNQLAQFSPRSGGTAAAASDIDKSGTADLLSLEGGLTNNAASGAAHLGTTEQGLGMEAQQLQDQASQEKLKNQQDSILGQAIGGLSSTLLNAGTAGLGMIPGLSAVI